MDFDASDTPAALMNMPARALDALDFGVIAMSKGGIVQLYNAFEAQLSGYRPAQVIGRDYFVSVQPCTNNFMVRGAFFAADPIDMIIDYVMTYKLRPTPVRMRLVRPATGPWLIVVEPL